MQAELTLALVRYVLMAMRPCKPSRQADQDESHLKPGGMHLSRRPDRAPASGLRAWSGWASNPKSGERREHRESTGVRTGGAESIEWKSKSLAVVSEEAEMKCVRQAENWMSLIFFVWSSSMIPVIFPVSTSHFRMVQSSCTPKMPSRRHRLTGSQAQPRMPRRRARSPAPGVRTLPQPCLFSVERCVAAGRGRAGQARRGDSRPVRKEAGAHRAREQVLVRGGPHRADDVAGVVRGALVHGKATSGEQAPRAPQQLLEHSQNLAPVHPWVCRTHISDACDHLRGLLGHVAGQPVDLHVRGDALRRLAVYRLRHHCAAARDRDVAARRLVLERVQLLPRAHVPHLAAVVGGGRQQMLRVGGHVQVPDRTVMTLIRTQPLAGVRAPHRRVLVLRGREEEVTVRPELDGRERALMPLQAEGPKLGVRVLRGQESGTTTVQGERFTRASCGVAERDGVARIYFERKA
jgi:hypothetical protein